MSPPRVPRDTPSLVTDKKKEVRRRKSDDMNSHAFCRTSRSSSPGRPSRLTYSLPPEATREDALDPTPRPETSSKGPNATRPPSVVPAAKTRLPFRAPPIHGHNRRTGLTEANQQNPERRVDQTTFLRARSSSPNYIRGHLFFSSHPPPRGALELELRRRRHTGGLQQSVDTITSHVSAPPTIHVRRSHWRYQRGEHSRQRDRPRRTANPSRSVLNSLQIM